MKLKCDESLSNFAFNFNLRRYIGGVFACSELLCANTTALLGTGCTALFLDKRTARVILGGGHVVTEASDGLADGSVMAVRGGVLYTDRFRDGGQSSTASIMVRRCRSKPVFAHTG